MDKRKRKYTKAERKARSERMMGNTCHKGHTHTEESIEMMRIKATNRVVTEATREKTRQRMMGNTLRKGKYLPCTQERRQRISDKLSGKPKSWYNINIDIPWYLIPNPKIFSEVFR